MSDDQDATTGADEEVVPDYSRVGFRQLQALCKDRGLPGDGNSITLIERLKAYDVQHGRDVDLGAAYAATAVEEDDPLGLDEEDEAPVSTEPGCTHPACVLDHPHAGPAVLKSPVDGGEAASAPPSTGTPAPAPRVGRDVRRPDPSVKAGVVKTGEGHGAAEAQGFRAEYIIDARDITDSDHFGFIAATHEAAQRAGHVTRGGATAGERVSYHTNGEGRRTVVYQVTLRRER